MIALSILVSFSLFSHKPDQIEMFSFDFFFRSFVHSIIIIMLWCRAFIKILFSCHWQTYSCFTILIMWIYSIINTEKFIHHSILSLYNKLLNGCVVLKIYSISCCQSPWAGIFVKTFWDFLWFWLWLTCRKFLELLD